MSPSVRVTGSAERAARLAARRPSDLVVCVGPGGPGSLVPGGPGGPGGPGSLVPGGPGGPGSFSGPADFVSLEVRVASPALGQKLRRALRSALAPFEGPTPALPRRIAASSRRALARRADETSGAVVVVRVGERNARHLVAIVGQARAAGCAAVQLVWNGHSPSPALVEAPVFAALEAARAAPERAPVVLTPRVRAPAALGLALAARRKEPPR
ncbi:MAG: hypothetical protein MUF34_17245 [Polyangiaceae bacterium]|nr:hypothetical protein [Polyangiaceae bacterium]